MFREKVLRVVLCVFCACAGLLAQQAPATTPVTRPEISDAYVGAQFGPSFHLLRKYPVITADFDGDATEDLAVVATSKDPLIDQLQFHFKTVDPYDAFFGWSDPKDTLPFASAEGEARFLLVVHDWRAATPKEKFVLINLPFQKLSLSRFLTKKKKVIQAIELEDRTGLTSDVFWDGKRWKWADKSLKTD